MPVVLRPDGPHSDPYTAEVAEVFAETVRVLCRATRSQAGGLDDPATAYALTGSISSGVYGLAQLFGQITAWLDSEVMAGRLSDDRSRPLSSIARRFREDMSDAATYAARLAESLDRSQQILSGLQRDERAGGIR